MSNAPFHKESNCGWKKDKARPLFSLMLFHSFALTVIVGCQEGYQTHKTTFQRFYSRTDGGGTRLWYCRPRYPSVSSMVCIWHSRSGYLLDWVFSTGSDTVGSYCQPTVVYSEASMRRTTGQRSWANTFPGLLCRCNGNYSSTWPWSTLLRRRQSTVFSCWHIQQVFVWRQS